MEELIVREVRGEDLEQAAELIVRMKRLNGEFDPLFKVVDDARERAIDYLRESMDAKDHIVIVAARGAKVVGVLRAEIRRRLFYEPAKEGHITDFYILPEARRKALGNDFLLEATKRLKQIGAEMIVAEFPAQNEIAGRFYGKRGFRALVNVYARKDDEPMQG
jgi:ribosomal protein S18 acetylase RimI-like enzyme